MLGIPNWKWDAIWLRFGCRSNKTNVWITKQMILKLLLQFDILFHSLSVDGDHYFCWNWRTVVLMWTRWHKCPSSFTLSSQFFKFSLHTHSHFSAFSFSHECDSVIHSLSLSMHVSIFMIYMYHVGFASSSFYSTLSIHFSALYEYIVQMCAHTHTP